MNKFTPHVAITTALIAGLATAPAFAGSRYGYDDRYNGGRTEYAQVVSADPIYQSVRVSRPRQECWDERVTYRDPGYQANVTAGTILGGIIGGVAGHQIGGGHGRDVATAVGAVIGAGVGNNATSRNRGQYERSGYETRCETVNDVDYEQRIDGYDVTYRYNGQIYQTRMPYDPGRRIPVNVDVRPAGY